MYIEPYQEFKFFDLIIFEPKVLQLNQSNLQMTLYVKTGSSVLQSVNLTGQSVASLIEVSTVQKVVQNHQQATAFNLKDYLALENKSEGSVSCQYLRLQGKITVQLNGEDVVLDTAAKMHKHLNCLNDQQQLEYVYSRLFYSS